MTIMSLSKSSNSKKEVNSKPRTSKNIGIEFCVKYAYLYLPIFLQNAFKYEKSQICTVYTVQLKEKLESLFNALGIDYTVRKLSYCNGKFTFYYFELVSFTLKEVNNIPDEIKGETEFINNNLGDNLNPKLHDYLQGNDLGRHINGSLTFLPFKSPQTGPYKDDIDNNLFLALESIILTTNNSHLCADYKPISKVLVEQSIYQIADRALLTAFHEDKDAWSTDSIFIYSSILCLIGINSTIKVESFSCYPFNNVDEDEDTRNIVQTHYRYKFNIIDEKITPSSKEVAKNNLLGLNIFSESELDVIISNALDIKNGIANPSYISEYTSLLDGMFLYFRLFTDRTGSIHNPVPTSLVKSIVRFIKGVL